VTELVRDDPDAGVLGLHDVVVDLDAGARDGVAAGGRVDVAGVRPDGVGALGTTVVGLVGAGVDDHEVVDDAVGLEQVAVAVDVALVLDVVVGPGEAGITGREGVDRIHHQLADLAGVVGVAGVGLDRLAAGGGAVVGLGVRHLDPAGDAAGDVVGALGHLAVVVLDGVAAQVDAGPAVGAGQVGPDPLGQAGLGVDELVVVAGAEVGHPEGVVVGAAAEGRRVGQVVVQRAVQQRARRLGDAVLGADEGRALEAGEVVVGVGVELDQDGQQLGRLGAGGVLEGPRALARLGGHRLQPAELPAASATGPYATWPSAPLRHRGRASGPARRSARCRPGWPRWRSRSRARSRPPPRRPGR
jgi:hypothetical protein